MMASYKQDLLLAHIPRGKGFEDDTQKENLISHPKEIAEHVMLLDLGKK